VGGRRPRMKTAIRSAADFARRPRPLDGFTIIVYALFTKKVGE
jgi:hypothetical protein